MNKVKIKEVLFEKVEKDVLKLYLDCFVKVVMFVSVNNKIHLKEKVFTVNEWQEIKSLGYYLE